MDNELSGSKLYEMIRKISSSEESLEVLTDHILKVSSHLDDLIRVQYETKKCPEQKQKITARKT